MESTSHAPGSADGDISADPTTADRMPEGVLSINGSQLWALTAVDPAPEQVATVRRQARLVLHWWTVDQVSWVVELLLGELAGNVVRHVGTPYDVTMRWDRHTLHASVRDASRAPPQPRVQVPDVESEGRGLLLISKLAARWGWEPHADGKTVWFDLVPPPTRPDGTAHTIELAPRAQ
jgi:anti-sigma regulatory factor (Ser/Thr protein kinase)